jgi:serine/threonine-protein kinase
MTAAARGPAAQGAAAAHGITVGADIGPYSGAFLTGFLKGSGPETDFIGFGFYGQNAGETKTNGQLIAALPVLTADLSGARALIDNTVRGGTKRVAIRVDGWDIAGDASASVRFTPLAATWDADALGRILTGGAASLANGASGRLVYDGSGTAPRAYQAGGPTPLYEAIGMFTGEGLFPGFGGRTVPVTTSLPGVDAFAAVSGAGSTSRDEIVVVNTSGSSRTTIVRVAGTRGEAIPLRAAQWRLPTVNGAVSTPASAGTATSENGSFELTLPSGSVTTIVITPVGSGSGGSAAGGVTTVTSAATGQCLAESARGVSSAPCDGAAPQKWRLSGTALVNASTGHCLAASTSGQVSAAACGSGSGLVWYSLGSRLVSARTGRCLNGNGTGEVYTLACDGSRQQNWTLGS